MVFFMLRRWLGLLQQDLKIPGHPVAPREQPLNITCEETLGHKLSVASLGGGGGAGEGGKQGGGVGRKDTGVTKSELKSPSN